MTKSADTYLLCDPWLVIEEGWHKNRNLVSESLFSLGNEYMGVRGYAEEGVTAESARGSYFNGIYEEIDLPQSYKGIVTKTHFMVNTADWLAAEIRCGDEKLDMALCEISGFRRVLDMRQGILCRSFDWHTKSGPVVRVTFTRFLAMDRKASPAGTAAAFQKIHFAASGEDTVINVAVSNSFNTVHGWDKKNWWNVERKEWREQGAAVHGKTIRTGQQIFSAFTWKAGGATDVESRRYEAEKSAGFEISLPLENGGEGWIEKSIINYAVKRRGASPAEVWEKGMAALEAGLSCFDEALEQQKQYWAAFWKNADIRIEGDPLNQQGIRFCIFQMHQTYNGRDPSNNIGAKGLTGESYNGHTFWDTETYCLPFFLFSDQEAAKNLLEYRYTTLAAAKDRAVQLDCRGACYPVATLSGEEGCNLWQHASLQFQASTGVVYGIAHYVNLTGDVDFLYGHGAEMLVEISRFLVSRGSWAPGGGGFGFYAVMGPDEFHMMVNNNCYTNFMAKKTFEFTAKTLDEMERRSPEKFTLLLEKTKLAAAEREEFIRCADSMIILYDESTKLFEQHEGYFGLPGMEISRIPVTDFPLYNNWSYDRIYRTDMIKQPDVLMFLFLYSGDFSRDVKLKNYAFYEPRTIHESSLSPSIHSIFACELGMAADAFRLFAFATRMDLDNYNRNTCEGLHTTSIAAAWMNIVYGFGGLRSDGEELSLAPVLPSQWEEYEFTILCGGVHVKIKINAAGLVLETAEKPAAAIPLKIYGRQYRLDAGVLRIPLGETTAGGTREESCTA